MNELLYALATSILSSLIWYYIQLSIENNEKKSHFARLEKEEIAKKTKKVAFIEGENPIITNLYSTFFSQFTEYKNIYIKDNELIMQTTLFTRLTRTIYLIFLIPFGCLPFLAMIYGKGAWFFFRVVGVIGVISVTLFCIYMIVKLLYLKIRIDIANKVLIQRDIEWKDGKYMYNLNDYSKIEFNPHSLFPVVLEMGYSFSRVSVCALPLFWATRGFKPEKYISFINELLKKIIE